MPVSVAHSPFVGEATATIVPPKSDSTNKKEQEQQAKQAVAIPAIGATPEAKTFGAHALEHTEGMIDQIGKAAKVAGVDLRNKTTTPISVADAQRSCKHLEKAGEHATKAWNAGEAMIQASTKDNADLRKQGGDVFSQAVNMCLNTARTIEKDIQVESQESARRNEKIEKLQIFKDHLMHLQQTHCKGGEKLNLNDPQSEAEREAFDQMGELWDFAKEEGVLLDKTTDISSEDLGRYTAGVSARISHLQSKDRIAGVQLQDKLGKFQAGILMASAMADVPHKLIRAIIDRIGR